MSYTRQIDEELRSYATERECQYIDAINKHQGVIKAAEALGVRREVVSRGIQRVKARAAQRGYSPEHDMTRTVPDGFKVKGVSTYYDEEGKPRGQWVKSTADADRQREMMREAFEAMAQDLKRVPPVKAPKEVANSLATLYTFTDSHVGMLAWHKEGGDDWDLSIAERTLTGCFARMVEASPPARTGIINQLGDFLHYDSLSAVTPTSGHVLDADGRFSKMVAVAVRILRRIIDMALAKHEKVVLLLAEGNHDMASSVWLRVMFRALYENEPRVEVIDSELPYYAYQHGRTMLAFHHGHLKKNEGLPLLFAAQFPQMWGATTKRYAHSGHWHHKLEKEHSGITVVQHPTLAARDAYAARGGYLSEREVRAIVYHDQHGEVARNTVTPEMLG